VIAPVVAPELPESVAPIDVAGIRTPVLAVLGTEMESVGETTSWVTFVIGIDAPHVLVMAMLFESAGRLAYHQTWSPAVVGV
jgi:hypothetical protein